MQGYTIDSTLRVCDNSHKFAALVASIHPIGNSSIAEFPSHKEITMLDRLMKLIEAFFNKSMSKMETPEVLAEQAQSELEENVKKIKEAVISGIANEKMIEGKIKKNAEDLALWEKRAMGALQQNDEELAKQCLQKKQEFGQNGQSLEQQLADQKKTNISLKERSAELEEKLRDFKAKRKELTARSQATDTVTKAHELLSGTGSSASSMDKWEEKIREKEARGEALREISGAPMEDKFKNLDKNMALDDELAALKAKMGAGPKLIVDQETKTKAIVDKNVPIVREEIVDAVDVEEVSGDEGKKQ